MASEPSAAQLEKTARNVGGPIPITPPVNGESFPPKLRWDAGSIDYANHPAYRGFVGRAGVGEMLSSLRSFGAKFTQVLAKRLVRYEMIPSQAREAGGLALWREALKNMISRSKRGASGESQGSPLSQLFARDGVAAIPLSAKSYEAIAGLSQEHFANLAQRRAESSSDGGSRSFDESRATASKLRHGALYEAVEAALKENGVFATASAYLGRDVRLVDINPQINDRSDSFWREIFPDVDLEKLPSAAYFHRDASGGDLKAIIYMTDVAEENGPFSYVVGSQKLGVSRLDDWICEANDHGLSATDPEVRKAFSALPAKLRQKCAFGNDLGEDTDLAEAIAAGTWRITAPAGSVVIFDTKGIHRGGMVEEGERRVLTCVLG